MPLVNGNHSPLKQAQSIDGLAGSKRKRVNDQVLPYGIESSASANEAAAVINAIGDILVVASGHDAAAAILDYPIPEVATPQSSKQKRSAEELKEPATISHKVAARAYTSLSELDQDLSSVCEAQVLALKQTDDWEGARPKRLSIDDIVQVQDIMSFKLYARDLIAREIRHWVPDPIHASPKTKKIKASDTPAVPSKRPGRSVLSLYGNAPNARQLFSSLQEDAELDMPLEQLDLPSSLTASQLLPIPENITAAPSKSTFGETYPVSSKIAQLQPPSKQSRQVKSATISFVSAEERLTKLNRKGTYTVQPLYAGLWLRYGSRVSQTVSGRDDSLPVDSAGEQEKQLLTAAYSSFAPTQDGSRAIFSADARGTIWWQKTGHKRLQSICGSGENRSDAEKAGATELDESEIFKGAVDSFDETRFLDDGAPEPRDVQNIDLLEEINELLKTLASCQRIRNFAEWHAPSRNPTSPAPSSALLSRTPKEPSDDEMKLYRCLKDRLAGIIDIVPPYVVAKLCGEQLEDLRVSKEMLMSTKSLNGVLEEDQMTKLAKSAAAAAAAASAAATSSGATGRHTGGSYSQYNRPQAPAARSTMTPQAYSGNARASLGYNRSSSGAMAGSTVTPSTSSSRLAYNQYGAHNAPVNRASAPMSYAQSANQQYKQRQGYPLSGSPQPVAPRPNPSLAQQQSQYHYHHQHNQQRPQLSAASTTLGYNHNKNTFGVQRDHSARAMSNQVSNDQRVGQQRPGSNGTGVTPQAPTAPMTNGGPNRT